MNDTTNISQILSGEKSLQLNVSIDTQSAFVLLLVLFVSIFAALTVSKLVVKKLQ